MHRLRFAPDSNRFLDEAEHFQHNQKASLAALRRAFGFTPEWCSASSRIRVQLPRNTQLWPGPGKVHASGVTKVFGKAVPNPWNKSVAEETEEAGYLPARSGVTDRYNTLKSPSASIAYIAAIMRAGSDIAEENGFIMSDDPVALTEFYQGWDLERWRKHMKAKAPGTAIVGADPMPVWVSKNLDYLEDAVGKPSVRAESSDTRVRVVTKAAGR